jgi:hypothetical protein
VALIFKGDSMRRYMFVILCIHCVREYFYVEKIDVEDFDGFIGFKHKMIMKILFWNIIFRYIYLYMYMCSLPDSELLSA